MNKRTHILKQIRTGAEVTQQDVAFLLDIDTGNLARYENEKRMPTPEILLLYHILFGIPISDLLAPQLERVKRNLIDRSKLLHAQTTSRHTPKSVHSISYIQAIVNNLKDTKTHDC